MIDSMTKAAADDASDNIEALKRKREVADLRVQIKALTAPWWRKASLITLVTGIIASVVPVTAAVEQHYKTKREFLLEQAKQDNDIRIAYLDRYQLPGHRLRTLRFLAATSSDEKLVAWARTELPLVQSEIDDIDKRLAAREKDLAQLPPGTSKEELQKEIDELKRLKETTSFAAPVILTTSPSSMVPLGYGTQGNVFVPIAPVAPVRPVTPPAQLAPAPGRAPATP
jgi:hypothetical protein